jgi:hypothetical protein
MADILFSQIQFLYEHENICQSLLIYDAKSKGEAFHLYEDLLKDDFAIRVYLIDDIVPYEQIISDISNYRMFFVPKEIISYYMVVLAAFLRNFNLLITFNRYIIQYYNDITSNINNAPAKFISLSVDL